MSKISLFPPAKLSRGSHMATKEPIELMDFLNDIKYGKYKDDVLRCRQAETKEQKKEIKDTMYGVTISGVFQHRKQENLIAHSGFICIDIDGFSDKSIIEKDQYTFALFYSVGGNGLAVVVKINPAKHKESFQYLSEYYFKTYGIVVDPAPQNVASLRYVSYDPGLIVNEKAKTSLYHERKSKNTKKLPLILNNDDFGNLINEIQSKQINIAESYEDYRNIGFALASEFGEEGRRYFHVIARVSAKYQEFQADKQYTHCMKGRQGITIATLYWMCKEAGIKIENKYKKEVQIASIAKKNERTKEAVKEQLVTLNKLPEDVAGTIVESVYASEDVTAEVVAIGTREVMEALMEFLRQNYKIRKNTLTGKIEINDKDMTTESFNTILLKAKSFFDSREITRELLDSLVFSEFTESYNPIEEYIEKNKYRNPSGNIKKLYECIESPTAMKDVFIQKWMISIIAAYDGHPVRSVLALTGEQNTGKSEFFRRLLPRDLQKYYAESKLDAGKDDELLMCQKLIVMDDEMGGKSKQDEKRFKELTSKHTFSIRAPYARFNEDYRRLAILCGTSNDPSLISDPTGNTRILPVEVTAIDHAAYNAIDKEELFMEAYNLYHSGEEWQMNKKEIIELKELSDEFEHIPYERELIVKFFKKPEDGESYEYMNATEIKNHIEQYTYQKITNMIRFGVELKKAFGRSVKSKGAYRYKVFLLPLSHS